MQNDLIFDVGMHNGQDSEFYCRKGYRVVAIEANPLLCSEVGARLKAEVDTGKLTILNVGIAPEEGELSFYVNDTLSHWSSFERELGARLGKFTEITVRTKKLSALFAEHGVPHYVKIDIEGYDLLALQDVLAEGLYPKFLSIENGRRAIVELLVSHGYSGFKFINQAKVQEATLPNPAREGKLIQHVFPFGASGPFGEETAGPWLGADEVSDVIDAYWNTPNFNAEEHGWFDLHAKRL
ncbi:FkbM family methyltransferase [soil metagenome]